MILNRRHPAAAGTSLRLAELSQFMVAMYPHNEQSFCYREIYRHFSPHMPFLCMAKQENILSVVAREKTVAAVFPKSAIARPSVWGDTLVSLPVTEFPMPGDISFFIPRRGTVVGGAARLSHVKGMLRIFWARAALNRARAMLVRKPAPPRRTLPTNRAENGSVPCTTAFHTATKALQPRRS